MIRRDVKHLPSWLPVAIFGAMLIVVAGYAVFTQINKRRVVGVYVDKAIASKRQDKYGAAVESLEKAQSLDPENKQIQTEQLKFAIFKITQQFDPLNRLMDLDKIDRAEADCKRLLAADSKNAELTALLGIIYAHQDRPALAIETYKKSVELNSSYPNVRNYWGYTMTEWFFPENWNALATQEFNEALALDPTYVAPRINLSLLAIREQRYDDAIGMLQKAKELAPDNAALYVLWGVALGYQIKSADKITKYQKYSELLERYRIAEALNPESLAAHLNQANALLQLGSFDAAINEYEKALKLEPSFVEAHQSLARALLDRNRQPGDLEEALKHVNLGMSFTDRIIQQYQVRKGRTTEAFAQQKLDDWTIARKKDRLALEAMLQEIAKKQEQP